MTIRPQGPGIATADVADVLELLRDALREARAALVRNADRVDLEARDLAFDAATAAEAEALRSVAESDSLTRGGRRWFERAQRWREQHGARLGLTPTLQAALGDLDEAAWRVPPRIYRAVIGQVGAAHGETPDDSRRAAREAMAWLDTALVAAHTILGAACHDLALIEIIGAADALRLELEARFPASGG
jgi:hypothetical protein